MRAGADHPAARSAQARQPRINVDAHGCGTDRRSPRFSPHPVGTTRVGTIGVAALIPPGGPWYERMPRRTPAHQGRPRSPRSPGRRRPTSTRCGSWCGQRTNPAHDRPYSGLPAGHELRVARSGSRCVSAVFTRSHTSPRRVLPTARGTPEQHSKAPASRSAPKPPDCWHTGDHPAGYSGASATPVPWLLRHLGRSGIALAAILRPLGELRFLLGCPAVNPRYLVRATLERLVLADEALRQGAAWRSW
jgi:hypothetical protein